MRRISTGIVSLLALLVMSTLITRSIERPDNVVSTGVKAQVAITPTIVPISGDPNDVLNETAIPMGLPVQVPTGVPAIVPMLAGVPAFTEQDVRNFMQTYRVRHQRSNAAPPVIDKVEFVSGQEVNTRWHVSSDLPNAAPLCIVTLRGDFLVAGPAGMSHAATTGIVLFDAITGNFLMQGIRP